MRNKVLMSIAFMVFLGINLTAQESANKFENNLIIATKLQTVPPVSEELISKNLELWELIPSNKKSLTRFIVDVKNESFLGYKLLFSKVDEKSRYKLTLLPLGESFKIPTGPKLDYTHFKQKSLSKYPADIMINDGDTLVLDLLENPNTGSKVQDLIKITTTETATDKYFEKEVSKDFSVRNINLKLIDFKTLVNKIVVKETSEYPVESHIIGFHFKDKGRYLLSAFPQEKQEFQEIGYIENNKMYFGNGNDSFEVISKENILPSKGKWTLWGKFIPESEIKDKIDSPLPFITEGHSTVDEPNVEKTKRESKARVIKYINWY